MQVYAYCVEPIKYICFYVPIRFNFLVCMFYQLFATYSIMVAEILITFKKNSIKSIIMIHFIKLSRFLCIFSPEFALYETYQSAICYVPLVQCNVYYSITICWLMYQAIFIEFITLLGQKPETQSYEPFFSLKNIISFLFVAYFQPDSM